MLRVIGRTLCSEDFAALRQLEADGFGAAGERLGLLPRMPAVAT
jgi:hypothetical protein